jgi:hypothetical protein
MKIIIDQKMVKRNGKIGKILRWISIGLLGLALFAVFSPNILNNQNTINIYFIVMVFGVFISSIGNNLTSRYGRSPRPDELIDKSLKGLDDKFTILHYETAIPHLLVSQTGIWSLIPSFVDGTISYDDKKKQWVRKGGSFLNKFLSREALGRPDRELAQNQKDFDKLLKSNAIEAEAKLKCAVVLLHKNVVIADKSEENDVIILTSEKVKEKFRKMSKSQASVSPQILNFFDTFD